MLRHAHRFVAPLTLALLTGACLLSPQSVAAAGTTIHAGDQLSVQVYGDQGLTQNVTVLDDGTIAYPLIGQVPVAGKTPEQAAELLKQRLLKYVRHPVVTVAISQLGQPNVMVLGDVKNPGKYQLRSDARLSDAIAAAGGLAQDVDGDYPMARVSNPAGAVTQVSLQKLLRQGDTSADAPLTEGDVVYVPGPVQFFVNVSGAVDKPGPVQVNQGDTLAIAIAKAGNSANSQADLNHVRLIRTTSDGKQVSQEINLYDTLQSNDKTANVALQKGDTIYVPQMKQKSNVGNFMNGFLYILTRFIP
ncbi:MAG TPA: polysaccharide biosynthesis/export family protein [Candidatus Baltobacteraceae bacterium]|nr:polysaccharide biosynthesis/export family protein [Candidatus Baltobacteraceae bacterium]